MNNQIKVPPLKVCFDEDMRKSILMDIDEVLASGMVAQGQHTKAFEDYWANYCGTKYAVSCSNGGSALELIFRYIDVRDKDVLVPTNTFIATANAVIAAGGRPILLDTDYSTLCINLEEIKRKLTKNSIAVCIVHIGGIMSPELTQIAEYCRGNGLYLVEDAAHAHGSELNGRKSGKYGIAAAYSFFSTKIITSTEGGMIVTDDPELANFVASYRDYGKKSQWESVHTAISMNYRLSEICSIIGLAQAKKLDEFISYRENIAKRYIKAFSDQIEIISSMDRNSWYKFTLLLPKGINRDNFKAELKNRNISLAGGVYDLPLHQQPVFSSVKQEVSYPVADDVCSRHICLPIFYGMTDEQVKSVIDNVNDLLRS